MHGLKIKYALWTMEGHQVSSSQLLCHIRRVFHQCTDLYKHTNFPKGKSLACCSRQCGQRISESNRELGIFGGHFMLTLKFWSKIRTIPHYLEGHQLGATISWKSSNFPAATPLPILNRCLRCERGTYQCTSVSKLVNSTSVPH